MMLVALCNLDIVFQLLKKGVEWVSRGRMVAVACSNYSDTLDGFVVPGLHRQRIL